MEMHIEDLVRWVHAQRSPEEIVSRVQEAKRRVRESGRMRFRTQWDGERLVAAVYFFCLPGRVATLGGVRAENGVGNVAAAQVNELARELLDGDIVQCQCVSAVGDQPTKQILAACEFTLLTQVAHIYVDLQASAITPVQSRGLNFRPASDFSAKRLARIVAETFADSQDCPELDGLRGEQDVLHGFLDGRQLRATNRWEVVERDGQPLGVLCLNPAGGGDTELGYFGVSRPARGRGLGAALASRAMELSRECGDNILAAAVDQRNFPALRTYEQLGFRHHQSFDVWLHRSHIADHADRG